MSLQCSICISSFKDPSCLPCGHLFCKGCIIDYVNSPQNTTVTTQCPECRSPFNTTMPDLTYVHKKYRPFITPALRRVYVDVAAHSKLEEKLELIEKLLESKRQMEELLLKKCEGMQAQVSVHQDGEHAATTALKRAEKKLKHTEIRHQETVVLLEARLHEFEKRNHKLQQKNSLLATKALSMEKRIKQLEEDGREHFDLSADGYSSHSTPQPMIITRAVKPLPRRSLPRKNREDSDSPSPRFAPPKRPRI